MASKGPKLSTEGTACNRKHETLTMLLKSWKCHKLERLWLHKTWHHQLSRTKRNGRTN